MRLRTTCVSWATSPSTSGRPLGRSSLRSALLVTAARTRSAISLTSSERSTASTLTRLRPAYARSCRHRFAAREAASRMRCRRPARRDPGDASAWAISAKPRIPQRRLLKSCAIPPARTPRLSSFWEWKARACNCCCCSAASRLSVMFRPTTSIRSVPSTVARRTLTSSQKRRPARSRTSHSNVPDSPEEARARPSACVYGEAPALSCSAVLPQSSSRVQPNISHARRLTSRMRPLARSHTAIASLTESNMVRKRCSLARRASSVRTRSAISQVSSAARSRSGLKSWRLTTP